MLHEAHTTATTNEVTIHMDMAKSTPRTILLSKNDAAERIGISRWTLDRMIRENRIALRPVSWSRRPMFRRVDIERLERQRSA